MLLCCITVLVFDEAKRSAKRDRRSGPIKAVVDVLVIVDNSLYRRAMERFKNNERSATHDIKKYYGLVMALVC